MTLRQQKRQPSHLRFNYIPIIIALFVSELMPKSRQSYLRHTNELTYTQLIVLLDVNHYRQLWNASTFEIIICYKMNRHEK